MAELDDQLDVQDEQPVTRRPPPPSGGEWQPLLRLLAGVVSFFTVILVIACLYWGQAVLVPVALALLLTFLLEPVVGFLQRVGLGRTVSVILVVLCAAVLFAAISWAVVRQVTGLAYDLRNNPNYKAQIREKLADLRGVGKGGVVDNLQATADEIMGGLEEDTPATADKTKPRVVVQEEAPASPMAKLQALLGPLIEPLGAAALVVVLVIFMLLKHEDLRNRLLGLFGSKQLTLTTRALSDAGERVSRYLLMQSFINSSYGAAVGVGLFFLGVPYALLWGFLAAVLRYVPYVGPWVAAVFPITISLVTFPGWLWPITVVCLFLVLELGSNMIMEPWLYGQSLGISEVGLLVVTGFWTWLWGPIGLMLATPLTVCIIVLGRHVPQLRLFDLLLGHDHGLAPHAIYYQRLLARDQEEATDLVEEFLREHTVEAVYDEMLIPALLLAWQDRGHGTLERDDETFVLQATREIVEDLDTVPAANGTDEGLAPPPVAVLGQTLILGCPAHHEAEEVIVEMLRQLARRSGYRVEVASTRLHASDIADRVTEEQPVAVFVAALPGALPQVRHLCKHLHNQFPTLNLVVGYWGDKSQFDKVLGRLRQAGANYLATSLQQSSSHLCALVAEATGQAHPPVPEGEMSRTG